MQQDWREALGKTLYDQIKEERHYRSIAGSIIEWEALRERAKEVWRTRAEAVATHLLQLQHQEPSDAHAG